MRLSLVILASVTGYLIGSISFGHLVIRFCANDKENSDIQHYSKGKKIFKSDSVSSTSVRMQLGLMYGCLVGILDILKGLLPSMFFIIWQPGTYYYLIAATFSTIGHIYPLYYSFKGGRGFATLSGGFVVLDWLGVLLMNLLGIFLGGFFGQPFLMRYAGLILMIPWIWFRTNDAVNLSYVIVNNLLFGFAILPELIQVLRLRKSNDRPDDQQVADLMGMGSIYRFVNRFNLKNIFNKEKKEN